MSCRNLSLEMKRGVFSINQNVTEKHAVENTVISKTKNPRRTESQIKTMLITFDVRSTVHLEFSLQGEAVSQADYRNIDDITRSGA